jgi:hypothetical protein
VINDAYDVAQRNVVILSGNCVALRKYSLRDVLLLSRGEPLIEHDAVWLHQRQWIGELSERGL